MLRVGTLLPEGAPAEYADPAVLFNAVELHETGRTARPAKKIVVALPREFTPGSACRRWSTSART